MRKNPFDDVHGDKVIGYKIMHCEKGYAFSLANRRLKIKLRKGTVVQFPGVGIFLGPTAKYVLDYYRGGANEVLLTFEFDPAHVVYGNLTDRESEAAVSRAKLIDHEILPDDE